MCGSEEGLVGLDAGHVCACSGLVCSGTGVGCAGFTLSIAYPDLACILARVQGSGSLECDQCCQCVLVYLFVVGWDCTLQLPS